MAAAALGDARGRPGRSGDRALPRRGLRPAAPAAAGGRRDPRRRPPLAYNVLQLLLAGETLLLTIATDAGRRVLLPGGHPAARGNASNGRNSPGSMAALEESQAAERAAAAEAERARLAADVHDVLAHTLSGLALQLEGANLLAATTPTDPRLVEAVRRAHRLSRSGLTEARRAVGALRGDRPPGPGDIPALVEEHRLASAGPSRSAKPAARSRSRRGRRGAVPGRPGGPVQRAQARRQRRGRRAPGLGRTTRWR